MEKSPREDFNIGKEDIKLLRRALAALIEKLDGKFPKVSALASALRFYLFSTQILQLFEGKE
jgi:hypothetical protein